MTEEGATEQPTPLTPLPTILLWPKLFEAPISDAPDDYYDVRLTLLHDIFECGALALTDHEGDPPSEIQSLIQKWPQKSRSKAETLLKAMTRHKSWVPSSVVQHQNPGCEWAWSAAQEAERTILPRQCQCDRHCLERLEPPGVILSNYWAGTWRKAMRQCKIAVTSMWTHDDLERLFWGPLLEQATTLTIVDRYIGRSACEAVKRSRGGSAERYRENIGRLAEWWSRRNPHGRARTLILYTPGRWQTEESRDQIRRQVDAIRVHLANWPWLTVQAVLKLDDGFPHERYVHTSRGSTWELSKGIDFFGSGPKALRHTVSRASKAEWDDVLQACDRLPDA